MDNTIIAAIMYDFDKTLSPRDMQEYAFIPALGMKPSDFWSKCAQLTGEHRMDPILAYMYCMITEAEGKMLLNRSEFTKLGGNVELFPGVDSWFDRVNAYGNKLGITVEHYIISSGLKEIIEGTSIAHFFKEIYAAEFCYNSRNVPVWPSMAVNYTSKTQFLFRINKGVLDVTEHDGLNEFTPENKRRVPFTNMIYLGDGLTDVPCMKLVKDKGGHSIAVYNGSDETANRMLCEGRVDFVAETDYSEGSDIEKTVFSVLNHIKSGSELTLRHLKDFDKIKNLI